MTHMATRKAELEITIRKAREEQIAIDAAERKADLDACVGKYFKYRNCYSCPSKPSDYWWLYASVIRMGKRVIWNTFQKDKDGQIMFKQEEYRSRLSWQEISRKEFLAAWRKIKAELNVIEESL